MGTFTAISSAIADIGNQFSEARLQDRAERMAIDRYNQERLHTLSQDFFKRKMAEREAALAERDLQLREKGQDINARWQDIQGWRAVGSPVRMGSKWVQRYHNIATGAQKDFELPGAPESAPEQQWATYYSILDDMARRRGISTSQLSDVDRTMAFSSVFGREPARAQRTDAQEFQDLVQVAFTGINNPDPAISSQWKQLLGNKSPLKWAQEQWLFRNAGYGIRAAMPGMPGYTGTGGRGRTGEAEEFGLSAGEKRLFDVRTAMHKSALQTIRASIMATIDPAQVTQLQQREQDILTQMQQIANEIISSRQRPGAPGQFSNPTLVPLGMVIPEPPDMDEQSRVAWSKASPGDLVNAMSNGRVVAVFEKQADGRAKRTR